MPHTPTYGPIRTIKSLGSLARAHRKATGLTMEEIMDHADLGLRFISEFERGIRNPRLDSVLKLLQAEGLEVIILPREQAQRAMRDLQRDG